VIATRHVFALAVASSLWWAGPGRAAAPETMPDRLEMNDGSSIRGLILRNSATSVLIQTEKTEVEIPKASIRRIHDAPDDGMVFSAVTKKGRLPQWRAIVHDFRNHDAIKSFVMVPATAVDNGVFRNIPYMSFRFNDRGELNVLGDPEHPVGLEFGIYGRNSFTTRQQRILREFLAGHLHSREELRALYAVNLAGGTARAGNLVFEITPPSAPDAYGGWWLSIYEADRLKGARLSDKEYAKVTQPFDLVNRRNGSLRAEHAAAQQNWLARTLHNVSGDVPKMRGFYRDKNGVFHLLGFDDS